jgi:prepilin-type N-terminal cleavage/methylation domain-containing protein
MKKKGFTLVELLAVIVILAIIALIATPSVLKMIEQARQGAAESSMLSYTSEIEKQIIADTMNTDNMGKNYDGTYSITGKTLTKEDGVTISLDIKGSAPEEGTVTITNSVVTLAKIKFGKYYVTYTYENKETSYCSSKKEYPTSCDSSSDKTETEPEEEPITVAVGDYVKMTPTIESYNIDNSLTNCQTSTSACSSGYQTIKPSELTLWRVIRVNDNGTYDAVSVYTSSTTVTFSDKTGYLKLVGTLNTIAKQYENSTYTTGSRMMGYNGQTETITDTSKFTTTAPWTKSTSDNSNEAVGGGDILYTTDTTSVKDVFGTLVANKVETTTATVYWLATRHYSYTNSTRYGWCGRLVKSDGSIDGYVLYLYDNDNGWVSYDRTFAVRPIITLRTLYADDITSGNGTVSDPYVLE